MKTITTTIAALALSSCAQTWTAPTSFDDALRAQGASESYIQGARHGCPSGASTVNRFVEPYYKDMKRAAEEPDYNAGWEDWFENCQAKMRSRLR